MKIITSTNKKAFSKEIDRLLNRFSFMSEELEKKVESIIKRVQQEGDQALLDYGREFDGVLLNREDLWVSRKEIKEAYRRVHPEEIAAMKISTVRIREFHRRQKKQSWFF